MHAIKVNIACPAKPLVNSGGHYARGALGGSDSWIVVLTHKTGAICRAWMKITGDR
jgi:hypothetical protein